jgi:hypothetical protein
MYRRSQFFRPEPRNTTTVVHYQALFVVSVVVEQQTRVDQKEQKLRMSNLVQIFPRCVNQLFNVTSARSKLFSAMQN